MDNIEESLNILVMDDEEAIRNLYCNMFKLFGCKVEKAKNGEEVIEILNKGMKFDIVILDLIVKDGMNGMECLQELKSRYDNIYVVASSGGIDEFEKEEYIAKGFNAILRKPFSMGEIKSVIEKYKEWRGA